MRSRVADTELILLSQCINDNDGHKERCSPAMDAVSACHRRREATLQILEANCGETQEAYEKCMEGSGGSDRAICLGNLRDFLACAESATHSSNA